MTAAVTLSSVEYLPPLAYKDCQPGVASDTQSAQLQWCDRHHIDRHSLEQFIAGGFAAAYDAQIS